MTITTSPSAPPPLVATADDALCDELLRLAAAAGVTPEIARDASAVLRGWAGAAVVLLGADLAAEVARLEPVRRDRVHVVALGRAPDELFRSALAVGAEDVASLPAAEAWVTELLGDLGEATAAQGLVLGVMPGSGGAGATTFACALAQLAARRGPTVVIDCDPLGPGVDRVLGLEAREGFRWDSLCQTSGRLSARALRDALPRRGNLGVLTWYAGGPGALQAVAVREALSAARRGHDTVVVDLPRSPDPLVDEVVARCDVVLVVVVPTVAGVASAARLCARFPGRASVRLVVRGRGIGAAEVARATGVPVLATMGDQRGLAEAIDLGLGPVRSLRGHLGRAAAEVLALSGYLGAAAAA